MITLKDFLRFLKMKFERTTETKSDYIMHMAELARSVLERENMQTRPHLFIFDDVNESTCKLVEHILDTFRHTKNVKIMCTTSYAKFYEQCTERNVFIKIGGVLPEEAPKFFKEHVKRNNSDQDIQDLALKMGYLSYGLVLANSYIFTTGLSVKMYMELLSKKEFLKKVEELMKGTSQEYDKGLVSAHMRALEKVESSSVHVKSLLRLLPFLHHSLIPISLLKKMLPENIDEKDKNVVIGDLIANLRKFCIGEIEPTDQPTAISIHAITSLVLEYGLQSRTNVSSTIKELLWFFCKHLNIDCRLNTTLKRNLAFQRHATKVILRADELKDIHRKTSQFLRCFLHTAIGVTFRVGGADSLLADEHLNKARSLCFQLADESSPDEYLLTLEEKDSLHDNEYLDQQHNFRRSESSLSRQLSEMFHTKEELTEALAETEVSDSDSVAFEHENVKEKHKQNARSKDATTESLYASLADVPKYLPKVYLVDLVTQMERSELDITHLIKEGGLSADMDGCLGEEGYEALLAKDLAMPRNHLSSVFIVELMVIILYNNGRNCYQWRSPNQQAMLKCWNELRLAYLLGELLRKRYPKFVSVQSLITRRNGILYHCLISIKEPNGEQTTKDVLEKIIQKYERMLEEEKMYFEFGIVKVSPRQQRHHTAMCQKLLLKCHTRLISRPCDSRDSHFQKAKQYADLLQMMLADMHDWIAVPGFHVQIARFFKLHQSPAVLEMAIKHFKQAIELENVYNLQKLSHFSLQAYFGLCKCYLQQKTDSSVRMAREICEMLLRCLHKEHFKRSYEKAEYLLQQVRAAEILIIVSM